MIEIEFAFVRNYPKNRVITAHSHGCFELVAYLDAECDCTINKNRHYAMHSDQIMLISPNTVHSEKHKGYSRVIAIGYRTDDPDLIFDDVLIHSDITILNSLNAIRKELGKKQFGYQEVIKNYLTIILYQFKRNLLPPAIERYSIDYALKYIDEYFLTDIDINTLASNTGYTPDYFRILFKEKTGINPKKYISDKKISHAKKLLRYSNMSVTEVSYNCGFNYVPQFLVFFKKNVGITPKQYRAKKQAEDKNLN